MSNYKEQESKAIYTITKHIALDPDLNNEIELYRMQTYNGGYMISWSGAIRELVKRGLKEWNSQ